MWVTDLLATFHVLFAVAWLGGGVMFGIVIGPRLASFSPPAAREFFVKAGPQILRFFVVVPALTVGFGLLLIYNITGGDWSQLAPTSSWGLSISAGIAFALAALIVSEVGATPALKRVIQLMGEAVSHDSPAVAKIPGAIRRAQLTATGTLGLLLATLACMVAAGFY